MASNNEQQNKVIISETDKKRIIKYGLIVNFVNEMPTFLHQFINLIKCVNSKLVFFDKLLRKIEFIKNTVFVAYLGLFIRYPFFSLRKNISSTSIPMGIISFFLVALPYIYLH